MPLFIFESVAGEENASIGGAPRAPMNTKWPHCKTCEGPMQFLARLPVAGESGSDSQALLLFQCQNQPGMCEEWAPDSGGNAALLVDGSGQDDFPVPRGETQLPKESRLSFVAYDESNEESAAELQYRQALSKRTPVLLGKIGGKPFWVQYD